MEEGSEFGQVGPSTKEIGQTTFQKVTGGLSMKMEMCTKGSGTKEKLMERDYI